MSENVTRTNPKISEADSTSAMGQARSLAAGLFPHQADGVAFLLQRRKAILADDMGLGKTRQSIVALRHNAPQGPYLVICPASVKQNWTREICGALPDSITCIASSQSPVEEATAEWVIVNYDILKKLVDKLQVIRWTGIIFDEAHYLKNHLSQRSRIARQPAGESRGRRSTRRRLCIDRYAADKPAARSFPLLQVVDHPLGRSFLNFAKRYCAATHNGYGWVTDGASNVEELALQPARSHVAAHQTGGPKPTAENADVANRPDR